MESLRSPARAVDAAGSLPGNFPAALTLDVFSSQADPVMFGEAGLIRAFVTTLAPSVGFELFLFKSDTKGLTQVTP